MEYGVDTSQKALRGNIHHSHIMNIVLEGYKQSIKQVHLTDSTLHPQ